MTKKDYITLAKAIKENRGIGEFTSTDQTTLETLTSTCDMISANRFIEELCDILKEDNPRFDQERFIAACK